MIVNNTMIVKTSDTLVKLPFVNLALKHQDINEILVLFRHIPNIPSTKENL